MIGKVLVPIDVDEIHFGWMDDDSMFLVDSMSFQDLFDAFGTLVLNPETMFLEGWHNTDLNYHAEFYWKSTPEDGRHFYFIVKCLGK